MIKDIEGHRPLPDGVYIAPSSVHGMGIFAEKVISKGHDFGITHVADDRFPDGYIRTPFGAYINHSYEPNCEVLEVRDTLHIRAINNIAPNEELTLNYAPYYTEDELANYK